MREVREVPVTFLKPPPVQYIYIYIYIYVNILKRRFYETPTSGRYSNTTVLDRCPHRLEQIADNAALLKEGYNEIRNNHWIANVYQ